MPATLIGCALFCALHYGRRPPRLETEAVTGAAVALPPQKRPAGTRALAMRRKAISRPEMLELVEQTVATMQQSASTIAKLPLGDRAEALRVLEQTYAVAMRGAGKTRWRPRIGPRRYRGVRQLVTQIDDSGGRYLKVIRRHAALRLRLAHTSPIPAMPNKRPPFGGGPFG